MAIGLVSDNSSLYGDFDIGYRPLSDMYRQLEGSGHVMFCLNEEIIEKGALSSRSPADMPNVRNSYSTLDFYDDLKITHENKRVMLRDQGGMGGGLLRNTIMAFAGIINDASDLKVGIEIDECKHVQIGFTSDLVETMKLGGF